MASSVCLDGYLTRPYVDQKLTRTADLHFQLEDGHLRISLAEARILQLLPAMYLTTKAESQAWNQQDYAPVSEPAA